MTAKKICCLLMAETIKALWSANAEIQFILLPLEVITVRSHCDQWYIALIPAGEGNAFSALRKSRVDFKTSFTSIAVQQSESGYNMLCKKPQMNFLWCSKNLSLSKKKLVVKKNAKRSSAGTVTVGVSAGCSSIPKVAFLICQSNSGAGMCQQEGPWAAGCWEGQGAPAEQGSSARGERVTPVL